MGAGIELVELGLFPAGVVRGVELGEDIDLSLCSIPIGKAPEPQAGVEGFAGVDGFDEGIDLIIFKRMLFFGIGKQNIQAGAEASSSAMPCSLSSTVARCALSDSSTM